MRSCLTPGDRHQYQGWAAVWFSRAAVRICCDYLIKNILIMLHLPRNIYHVVFYGIAMKKALFGLFLISSLLCPSSAKSNPKNQTIQGKQYIVLGGGARPISDNAIFYKQCSQKNECEEFESSQILAIAQETSDIAKFRRVSHILPEFRGAGPLNSVRTDFDGNYSFQCPTSQCLVFSRGEAGSANASWLKIVKANSKVDLTGSNAIHVINRPD